MIKKIVLSSILLFSVVGCAENGSLVRIGPTTQTTFVPMIAGNPATVIQRDKVSVIKTADGKTTQIIDENTGHVIVQGVVGDMELQGFDVIDDPTLQYYQMLHKLYGSDYQKKLANGEIK